MRPLPADKQLAIHVSFPQQTSANTWDTGSYDWPAIGQIADVVKILPASDPRDYVSQSSSEAMFNWAVSQINRHKIQPILRADSSEEIEGQISPISREEALARIKPIMLNGSDMIAPGETLNFALIGAETNTRVQVDPVSGISWFVDQDAVSERTTFLENAGSLSRKMQFLIQYNFLGVGVQQLADNDNIDPEIWQLLCEFPTPLIFPNDGRYVVLWQVRDDQGDVVKETLVDFINADFEWVAEDREISYQITALISPGANNQLTAPQIWVPIVVARPTPTPTVTRTPSATFTPPPTFTPSPTLTATPSSTPQPAATPVPQVQVQPTPTTLGGCSTLPRADFAALWLERREELGCPIEPDPLSGTFVERSFEHGQLFWVQSIDEYGPVSLIFALVGGRNEAETGTWSLHTDTWQGEGICPVGPPPPDLYLPDRNLAKVWCDLEGPALLGYATTPQPIVPDRGLAVLQNFERAILFRDNHGAANKLVYILLREDNTYSRVAY